MSREDRMHKSESARERRRKRKELQEELLDRQYEKRSQT